MPLIDLTGTFKGKPVDTGVSLTKNGFPQFVVSLLANEYWDETEQEWFDYSDQEKREITAYLVLFDSEGKPTLSASQIQKVFGWSGESFVELNNTNYTDVDLQFRVGSHVYKGEDRIGVDWIDEANAQPGRSVRKASEQEVKDLDKEYAHGLRKLSGGKTVTPTNKPKTEKPTTPKKKEAPKADDGTTPEAEPQNRPPEKPKKPAPKATGKTAKLPKKKCTKEQAWDIVCEARHESISDEQLEQVWAQTITDLGDEDSFTPADWYRVGKIVSTKVKDDLPF